jgi:sulfate adenylyltransferase subunit 1 (EFTu-like GTPase family)
VFHADNDLVALLLHDSADFASALQLNFIGGRERRAGQDHDHGPHGILLDGLPANRRQGRRDLSVKKVNVDQE